MPVNLDAGYTDNPWDLGDYEIPITADSYTIDYDYSDFDFTDGNWSPDYDSVFDDTGEYAWDMGDYSIPETADNYSLDYESGGKVNLDAGIKEEGGLLSVPKTGRTQTPAEQERAKTPEEEDFWDSIFKFMDKHPAVAMGALGAIASAAGSGLNFTSQERASEALLKAKSEDRDWEREQYYTSLDYRKERDAQRDMEHASESGRKILRNQGLGSRTRTPRARRFVPK